MTQEEKAKHYDEAIKIARKIHNEHKAQPFDVMLKVFPELKENEQSKKWILEYLYDGLRKSDEQFKGQFKAAIAWLEKQGEQKETLCDKCKKEQPSHSCQDITALGRCALEKQGEQKPYGQRDECMDCQFNYAGECKGYCAMKRGEQKPADKVEPKFKVGDWVMLDRPVLITKVEDMPYNTHQYWTSDGTWFGDGTDARLWTIQDAKDGDVLYSPCLSLLWIFKSIDTVYCGCNLNYNDGAFCGEGYIERPTDAIPATKEQRDTLMKAMNDAGYIFDFEKKELRKIADKEQIPDEWSEEDKNFMYDTLCNLTELKDRYGEGYGNVGKCIEWLKSLKDRYTWKPSDEQMIAIQEAMNIVDILTITGSKINRLYQDLKKLKK